MKRVGVRKWVRALVQAAIVAPRLRAHAVAWAASSGATLSGECSAGGGGAGLEEWIRAGLVKDPERAVTKALVCYEGDVSRLADLCRVRLVASDLPQAAAAVAAACGDSAVRVAGVKNGMTLGHSAALHAGFRVRPPPPAGPVHSITPLPDYNPHGPSVLV